MLFNCKHLRFLFYLAFSCCSLSFCSEVAQVWSSSLFVCVLEFWLQHVVVCLACLMQVNSSILPPHNQAVFFLQEMKRTRTFSKTSPRWHQMTQTNSTATEQKACRPDFGTSSFFLWDPPFLNFFYKINIVAHIIIWVTSYYIAFLSFYCKCR